MIKYIFFDLGDTLVDMSISKKSLSFGLNSVISNSLLTEGIISKWEQESYKTFEYYFVKGEFHSIKKLQALSLKKVLSEYNINLTEEKFSFAVDEFWRYFIKNCKSYEDVLPTLSKLNKNNYKIGLITNGDEENVTCILKKHKLNDIIKIKIISSIIKSYKPHPTLFELAVELAQCLAQEALYVGDSITDIYGAKKLGLTTVIINRNTTQDSEDGNETSFIINDLLELPDVINKIT